MNMGKLISFEKNDGGVIVHFSEQDANISVINDKIIRTFVNFENKITPSKAVVGNALPTEWTAELSDGALVIKTKAVTLKVYDDLRCEYYAADGRVLCRDYEGKRTPIVRNSETKKEILAMEGHKLDDDGGEYAYRIIKKTEGGEAFYGLGDKLCGINRYGYEWDMWNTDDCNTHTEWYRRLYKSIPFCIVSRKDAVYGLFFDNTCWSHFDTCKESDDYFYYCAKGGNLDLYFIYGDEMPEVLMGYTYLTGTTPLPQKWTLGYHQSRWGYISEKDVRTVAENMRKYGIPCDVIHLDIDYMEGYRVFTFNEKHFSKIKQLTADMAKQGIKIVTIIDPGVKIDEDYYVYRECMEKGYYGKTPEGDKYVNVVWPGECIFPDFGSSETREWWADKHKVLTDAGVRGVWNDMNEPFGTRGEFPMNTVFHDEDIVSDYAHIHNVYGHNESRATYEGLKKHDGKRPFVITRAAYAGSQRYALGWTGDNQSIWYHLQMAIPQLCSLSLSGMGYVGTDIGGFFKDTTKELLVRWTQFGAFSPFMRNHFQAQSRVQEPWQFDEQTMVLCRDAIKFRYKILPYIYDLFYAQENTGMPVIRPLVLHYEHDEVARECNGEFLVGENMLVAPVVDQGAVVKPVYFPGGVWYDYHTGERHEGKKWILRDAPIDVCPLYVKAGTVLPVWEEQNYVGEKDTDKVLRLEVFPGEGSIDHIQDNGEDFAYRDGEYNLYRVELMDKQVKITLVHSGYDKKYDRVTVTCLGETYDAELEGGRCTIELK